MEIRLVKRALAFVGLLAVGLCLTTTSAHAQVAGESVNMVSGIGWPGGDPFLQRQNEPTLAVSSANPMHLMAGANDYRAVDIKVPDADVKKINGDAWLGVFKSLDGGQNWKSVLLPGYPQDPGCALAAAPVPAGHVHTNRCGHTTPPPSAGGQFALCGLPAAADPVMRAGTDGMFYFAGINFQRDKLKSRVFLARYIDLNNKENGDATKDTDPLRYVDTRIIADAPPNVFIDKPWMTIDVPRAGAVWCEIPVSDDPAAPKRKFLGGTIYVGWSEFTLPDDLPTTTSTIKLTYSTDCGKTWVTPYALNTRNSVLNQGLTMSVEPATGRLLAAWRRIGTPTNKQTDAIMATRSAGRKKNFSAPRVVAKLTAPFDQGTSDTAFRTEAFPTMAISTDGKSSWVHVAWQQRKKTGVYESQIVMSTARIVPTPTGDNDPDEPDDYEPETRVQWGAPKPVDDHPTMVGDDAGNVFPSGHQVMPALTFGQGKLMLVYYDTRFDHTRRYFEPLATPASDGRFYKETLAPVGELARPKAPSVAKQDPIAVFNSWINDASLYRVRHTVDVRVASAPAGGNPVFKSTLASKFPFGIRGDEGTYARDPNGLKLPGFGATSEIEVVSAPVLDANGNVTTPGTLKVLQQLQSNPPNFPMFKNGSVAFMGDYIDIQGPAFVPTQKGGWAFNTAATPAPVFHAVWTSNQDVQVPRVMNDAGYPDWTQYAPPYCPSCEAPAASRYLNDGRTSADQCVPGAEASRDQNIYTARITEGLLVSTPQNMKPLSQTVTRAFVVVAQNSSDKEMTVSFAATVPSQGAPATVPAVSYSFTSDLSTSNRTLTGIKVPKRSFVSRSLFVKLPATNSKALTTLNVSVTETGCVGAACRSGFVTLNPATALGTLVQPDTTLPTPPDSIAVRDAYLSTMAGAGLTDPSWVNSATNPSWVNLGYSDPSWVNSSWTDPSWVNPPLTNSNWDNGAWTNPSWVNPSWVNQPATDPSWVNPSWVNPSWVNPSWVNPSWVNPSWVNPSWVNPSWVNPSWVNSSMSDSSYTITNTGNTTTSYHVKVVGPARSGTTAPPPLPAIQMNMTKWYSTPAAVNCKLIETPRFLPVVEVPDVPLVASDDPVNPGTTDGSPSNATVSLAPGESALIVLRANVSMQELAAVGKYIGVASIPSSFTPDGTKYKDLQGSGKGSTVGVGLASTTGLTYDSANAVATVTVGGGSPTPTGSIVIILNGKQLAARWPLDSGGVATASFSPPPPPGATLAAFYAGDGRYQASLSGTVLAGSLITVSRFDIGIDSGNPALAGEPQTVSFTMETAASDPTPLGKFQLFEGATNLSGDINLDCTSYGATMSCSGWTEVVLATGSHVLTGKYTGDANYLPAAYDLPWAWGSAAVTITPPAMVLATGDVLAVSASVTGSYSSNVTWTVEGAANGARVDSESMYHAPSVPGTYHLTATSVDDPGATATATVTVNAPGSGLEVRAALGHSDVNAVIVKDAAGLAVSGATVEVFLNGNTATPYRTLLESGTPGTYAGNFDPFPAGANVLLVVTSGTSHVAATGVMPGQPVLRSPLSPAAGGPPAYYTANPITVDWYPFTMWAGTGFEAVVSVSSTAPEYLNFSYTSPVVWNVWQLDIPANSLPPGPSVFKLYAVTPMEKSGDWLPGSSALTYRISPPVEVLLSPNW